MDFSVNDDASAASIASLISNLFDDFSQDFHMNIQDFISETLRQIGEGVDASAAVNGIVISPRPLTIVGQSEYLVAEGEDKGRVLIEYVEFDLSVAVQEKIGGTAGAEITIPFIGGGKGDISTGLDQTRIQRVKFRVPVIFKRQRNTNAP